MGQLGHRDRQLPNALETLSLAIQLDRQMVVVLDVLDGRRRRAPPRRKEHEIEGKLKSVGVDVDAPRVASHTPAVKPRHLRRAERVALVTPCARAGYAVRHVGTQLRRPLFLLFVPLLLFRGFFFAPLCTGRIICVGNLVNYLGPLDNCN